MLPKRKEKILLIGDKIEGRSFRLISRLVHRLLTGFFHFKKRKGELVAGSVTFFTILSFCPILLFSISLMGKIHGNIYEAQIHVLEGVKSIFPQLAPWILTSIEKIVNSQLHSTTGINVMNFFFLFYATLGVISSMVFGMNTISEQQSKGGFLIEDMKSIGLGALMSVFMTTLLIFSQKTLVLRFLTTNNWDHEFLISIVNYNILPIVSSLAFMTLFYKVSTAKAIPTKNAFLGACCFVSCFLVGKSFYWVYLAYSKETLSQNYGNFYTLFVAGLWIYYLMCSFFYGASVAFVDGKKIYIDDDKDGDKMAPPDLSLIKGFKKSS